MRVFVISVALVRTIMANHINGGPTLNILELVECRSYAGLGEPLACGAGSYCDPACWRSTALAVYKSIGEQNVDFVARRPSSHNKAGGHISPGQGWTCATGKLACCGAAGGSKGAADLDGIIAGHVGCTRGAC